MLFNNNKRLYLLNEKLNIEDTDMALLVKRFMRVLALSERRSVTLYYRQMTEASVSV